MGMMDPARVALYRRHIQRIRNSDLRRALEELLDALDIGNVEEITCDDGILEELINSARGGR